jgi:hypothetical protein
VNGDIRIEPSRGEVVEKEERLSPLDEDVVYAMADEIHTNRPVLSGHERDAKLCADAVCARDEHGIRNRGLVEPKQASKGSDVGQYGRCERPPGERTNASNDLVADVDVNA